jgi:predicted nucleic acid-binding protein
MVVFDATFLSHLLYPESRSPLDPSTGQPVEKAKERIEFLIQSLQDAKQKIIIPTPALSELLAVAAKPQEILELIIRSRWFEVYPFDQKAAIECAEFIRAIRKTGKKELSSTWAKAKFDYQIIAIAIVSGADTIYSDDEDMRRYLAGRGEIKVVTISQLPLPPPQQINLYDQSEANQDPED